MSPHLPNKTTVYTLGYQGLSLSAYTSLLATVNVGLVADIRETAWSHKRDFCKNALQSGLQKSGILYRHLRSAGNPSSNRRTASSTKECLDRYRQFLETNRTGVKDLVELIAEANDANRALCLMCFERSYTDCHRSILIEVLERQHRFLQFIHLPLAPLPLFNETAPTPEPLGTTVRRS